MKSKPGYQKVNNISRRKTRGKYAHHRAWPGHRNEHKSKMTALFSRQNVVERSRLITPQKIPSCMPFSLTWPTLLQKVSHRLSKRPSVDYPWGFEI